MQKCVYLQKISKCLLFKVDGKAVRTTLREFIFLTRLFKESFHSKGVCFTDMASTMLSEHRKENFNVEKARIITATTNLQSYETHVYL